MICSVSWTVGFDFAENVRMLFDSFPHNNTFLQLYTVNGDENRHTEVTDAALKV